MVFDVHEVQTSAGAGLAWSPQARSWRKQRCPDCRRRGEKLDVDKGEMKVD